MYRAMVLLTVLCLVPTMVFSAGPDAAVNWPQWRGPSGTGAAPSGNPPVEWSEKNNVRWKIALPGTGYSTPAIWGDTIYVTAAIPPEGAAAGKKIKFIVMALNRADGTVRWQKLAREEAPHEGMHDTTTWATGSPITDGQRVYAFFGSRGLYCYTVAGELVWEKDFGDMNIRREFGEGSSPVLYDNRLVVLWDHEGPSFITALDAASGKELWRKDRDERTSWSTPIVVEVGGKPQVIASGTNRVRSYDLATGDLVWDCGGLTENVIPAPVEANGALYVMSGFRGAALKAIRLAGAKGNLDGTPSILWTYDKDTPYVPSPLLLGGRLYFLKVNQGMLTCVDIATGKANYSSQRLEGVRDLYASPTGVGDRLYLMSRDGVAMVVRDGAEFTMLAINTLDDKFDASPAIVSDELYLRGHKYLYCIAR